MPDDSSGTGATPDPQQQASATGAGQQQAAAGTATGQTTGQTGGDQQGDPEGLGEAGRKALEKERESAKAARARASELEKQLRELREKDLPEAEKWKVRAEALEKENRLLQEAAKDRQLQAEVMSLASKYGLVDPELVTLLVKQDSEVEERKDGTLTGIEEAVKRLIKNKPYLARSTQGVDAGSGTRGTASTSPSMNDMLRRAAGHR